LGSKQENSPPKKGCEASKSQLSFPGDEPGIFLSYQPLSAINYQPHASPLHLSALSYFYRTNVPFLDPAW
jgi:hypothetical protein